MNRSLLTTMFLLTFAAQAHAQMVEPSYPSATVDTYCDTIAATARNVMAARQAGVPVELAYRQAYTAPVKVLILAAYSEPRFSSRGFQQQAIDEFTTRAFIACVNKGE